MFIRVSSLMSFSIITLFFLSPAIADQRSVEVPAKETGISTGNYFALIIGNNKYKYLPKLKTAVADATDVGKVLKDLYGFKTKLLLDATRSEILDGINEMREQLGPDDSLLIYYAGHGEYKEEADKAYWLPVDAQPAKTTNWIIADDITSNIKFITAKHILLVSDSCYSGALSRAATTELKDKNDREAYMKKMLARTSRTLMASGGNEPVSDSGGGNHSVFAAAFIKALSEADKLKFTAEELFQGWVKGSVAGKSDQVPGYGSIRNSGDEGGDFVFQLVSAHIVSPEVKVPDVPLKEAPKSDFSLEDSGGKGIKVPPRTSSTITDLTAGMEFVYVKGGCYQMGDTFGDGGSFEKPVHEVCVDAFYIGKYVVTQGEWKAIMRSNPSYFSNCGDNCPVEQVSWNDAQDFISTLNSRIGTNKYRLPTEAEWEYAARSGGKKEKWAGTSSESELVNYAWYYKNSGSKTHPVGQKKPNGLGLCDMTGNVWQWVQDWYNDYNGKSERNPAGASTGTYRVDRGGSWDSEARSLRAALRDVNAPDSKFSYLGLRLAGTP
jgi:formylglycine-generating enzyme required for sulfatase activity